jgi:hypothetical protein
MREGNLWIQLGKRSLVPIGDLAEVDIGKGRTVERQVTGLDPCQMHNRSDGNDHLRELQKIVLGQVVAMHRHVAVGEIDRLALDLLYTGA